MKGNEEAMGLNMLEHPDRKKEANLAKQQVSIPEGPFPLSGGTAALLFDPVMIKVKQGKIRFGAFPFWY